MIISLNGSICILKNNKKPILLKKKKYLCLED